MATHFGGIGNAPIEDPRTQEPDNGSENEFQEEDLMRQVLAETENIKRLLKIGLTNQGMPYMKLNKDLTTYLLHCANSIAPSKMY